VSKRRQNIFGEGLRAAHAQELGAVREPGARNAVAQVLGATVERVPIHLEASGLGHRKSPKPRGRVVRFGGGADPQAEAAVLVLMAQDLGDADLDEFARLSGVQARQASTARQLG